MTAKLLASLREQSYEPLKTIVVDNGSADQREALKRLQKDFPEISTVAHADNLGYAVACNAGIELGLSMGAEYLLLLNNDVILDRDAIKELVNALESHSGAGAAGPLIYHAAKPDTLWSAGGGLDMGIRGRIWLELLGKPYPVERDGLARESDWLTATVLLARREVIEKVGLMDTSYFLYWEDVDWSYRLRRAGYGLVVAPRARVWHQISASTGVNSEGFQYYFERNRLLFIERWGTRHVRLIAWAEMVVRVLLLSAKALRRDGVARAKLHAYVDYVRRRFGRQRRYF